MNTKIMKMFQFFIHDSNTTGLNGPIDGTPEGPFHAIKAQGLSANG